MSLLTIVQDATDRMGLARPSAIVASEDQQSRELLSFAKQAGHELMRAAPWQELIKEHSFTTVNASLQVASVPSDWNRFLDDSIYNRTTERKVWGPITPQEYQQRQAYTTASTIDYWFRLRGGAIYLEPPPAAGETVAYEYVSKNWAKASDDTPQSTFTSDNDGHCFPDDELMVLGLRWRWLKAKGFEWETPYQEYMALVKGYSATQAGSPTLRLGGRAFSHNRVNVPEGSWGQT